MFNKIIDSPLVKVPARYGAIAALLCMSFLAFLFYMGKHPFLISPFFDFRLPLFGLLLFFSLKEIRDYYQDGVLFFLHGLLSCLIFTLVFAFIMAFLIWIFCQAQPAFLSRYIAAAVEQFEAIPPEMLERIGKAELERNLNALPGTRAVDLAIDYFAKSFIMSFFISVIISVILRQQPKPE